MPSAYFASTFSTSLIGVCTFEHLYISVCVCMCSCICDMRVCNVIVRLLPVYVWVYGLFFCVYVHACKHVCVRVASVFVNMYVYGAYVCALHVSVELILICL